MSIAVATIITDDWIDSHLVRWVRYIRKNVKDAKLYLFYAQGKGEYRKHPVLAEFEIIDIFDGIPNRHWLNAVRMGATKTFGVDEILYLDADCDVLADLNELKCEKELGCVKSPVIHNELKRVNTAMGGAILRNCMNNGLIYMKRDFTDEYETAWEQVARHMPKNRIAGTVVFNMMLKDYEELPYEYGVIWWDTQNMLSARIIQYCNDQGQAKRTELEDVWRRSR